MRQSHKKVIKVKWKLFFELFGMTGRMEVLVLNLAQIKFIYIIANSMKNQQHNVCGEP
jgi:hypothetical protein